MSEKTYYALTNISLDGIEYAIGTAVPLTDMQAAQIKEAVTVKQSAKADDTKEVVTAKQDTKAKVVSLPNKTDDEVTQAQVVAAIAQLDPQNQAHWTKTGKPQIDALEEVTAKQVSGAIRDAAWETIEIAGKGE